MNQLAEQARERLSQAFEQHDRGVIEFSGGKDSLAALYLCRPWADRVTVIYGDTGDSFPHVLGFVMRTCEELGFTLVIASPETLADEYIAVTGFPVDVLPVWAHRNAAQFLPERSKPKVLMQSMLECCGKLLWEPVQKAVKDLGTSLVVRGSKAADEHVTLADGSVVEGVEYVSPLWGWTDDDVFAYLEEQDAELPAQYANGCNHSLDCMKCTAWAGTEAELQRAEFTRDFYPEQFAELRSRMRLVREETIRQLEAVEPFMNLVGGES